MIPALTVSRLEREVEQRVSGSNQLVQATPWMAFLRCHASCERRGARCSDSGWLAAVRSAAGVISVGPGKNQKNKCLCARRQQQAPVAFFIGILRVVDACGCVDVWMYSGR